MVKLKLTNLSLIGFPVFWKLNELFGKHAGTVAQDVTFKFDVRVGSDELQYYGVLGGVDANLHILSSYCEKEKIVFEILLIGL